LIAFIDTRVAFAAQLDHVQFEKGDLLVQFCQFLFGDIQQLFLIGLRTNTNVMGACMGAVTNRMHL